MYGGCTLCLDRNGGKPVVAPDPPGTPGTPGTPGRLPVGESW